MVGRPFSFTLPFEPSAQDQAGAATWMFDTGRRTLTLTFTGVGATDGEGVRLDYIEQPSRRTRSGEDSGRGLIARELDAVFARLPEGGVVAEERRTFRARVTGLDAAQGASLTNGLVVELEGRVSAFSNGAPNRCSLLKEDASPARRQSRHLVLCAVALDIGTIRFKTAQGRILQAWPASVALASTPAAPQSAALPEAGKPLSAGMIPSPQPARATPVETLEGASAPQARPPAASRAASLEPSPAPRSPPSGAAPAPRAPPQSAPLEGDATSLVASPIRWLRSPGPDEVERRYPLHAFREGLGGEVELSCLEGIDGFVRRCRVVSETPPGEGFGRAAVELSPGFQLEPAREAGRVIETWVRIPYAFHVTD